MMSSFVVSNIGVGNGPACRPHCPYRPAAMRFKTPCGLPARAVTAAPQSLHARLAPHLFLAGTAPPSLAHCGGRRLRDAGRRPGFRGACDPCLGPLGIQPGRARAAGGQPDLQLRAAQGDLPEALYGPVATHALVARAGPVLEVSVQASAPGRGPVALRVVAADALLLGAMAPELAPRPFPDAGRPRHAVARHAVPQCSRDAGPGPAGGPRQPGHLAPGPGRARCPGGRYGGGRRAAAGGDGHRRGAGFLLAVRAA